MTLLLPLDSFKKNVHSQFGEDGIISEILNRLSKGVELDKWCVEFGAWDGIHLSNTYNLITNKNYHSVLIEGDKKKYIDLCKNIPQVNAHKICAFVTFDGASTLDKLLASTPIPKNFDFLSIDIDGCDYHILDSLQDYSPKTICIEFNPTIPNEVEYIQPKNFSIKHSSSPKSILKLAESKGYKLVATTQCNLLLVKKEYIHLIRNESECTLENLRDDSEIKVFLFIGFDGTLLSNKESIYFNWHGIRKYIDEMQVLPKVLRRFKPDYNLLQLTYFKIWRPIKRLIRLIRRLQ
jgi:hypothetical protein